MTTVCTIQQAPVEVLGLIGQVLKSRGIAIELHPVMLTEAAETDNLWSGQRTRFNAFHWHGDGFDLPRGAVSLARSKRTDSQAFRYGASAYGLLFHLEMTEPAVRCMAKAFRQELVDAGANESRLFYELPAPLESLRPIALKVFGRWA